VWGHPQHSSPSSVLLSAIGRSHDIFISLAVTPVFAPSAKPSQSANWGAERKLMFPCLLAIPAFDRIAGLYSRHLTLTGEYAYANDFKVRLKALTDLAKD
jgi:hypothetical protein